MRLIRDQLTISGSRWVTKASSLGLRPGEWPEELYLGGFPDAFLYSETGSPQYEGNDLTGMEYRTKGGLIILLTND